MIREDIIPIGTYSVAFQTWWKQPYVGKNAYDHRVFNVYEELNEIQLAEEIAKWMTIHAIEPATCHMVKINSIHRLDLS